MVKSSNPGDSAPANKGVRAIELVPQYDLDAYSDREAQKQALSSSACIDDHDLLEALVNARFTLATLPALQLAPIAFVAWASESVTDEESQAAVSSFYESLLFDSPMAVGRVQHWIDVRPTQGLWELWVLFTEYQLGKTSPAARKTLGEQLLRQATSVAIASGGFIGIGKICAAEQVILDSIRDIYRI